MTTKEILEQLQNEYREYCNKHHEDPKEVSPEIPFNEKHNVGHQRRCCRYCRHALVDIDSIVSCVHPDRIARNADGIPNYMTGIRANSVWTDVCDAWEEAIETVGKTKEKE